MPEPRILVTTSWDDGHRLDLRLAAELDRFGVAATFYVAPRSVELAPAQRIDPAGLRELAERFEIGGHTLTHRRLTRLAPAAARNEIGAGKAAVEDVVGRAVSSFCYPYGAYTAEHAVMVRDSGFTLGRTIRRFCTRPADDPFQLPTSMHAARYRRDGPVVLRRSRGVRDLLLQWTNWDVLARTVFEEARAAGGVFHLWGHSWEVHDHGDWVRLRSLLAWLADQDGVEFVTNGQLLARQRGAA